jgi:uncharacterized protein YkwD
MTRKIGQLAVAASLVALLSSPAPAATCWDYRKAERTLARRINRARATRSIAKMTLDPQLSKVSRVHAGEMVDRDRLYHTDLSLLGRRVTRWIALGENIGRAGSTRRIFRAMMGSLTHRTNILNGVYRFVGVGTAKAGGNTWAVITFEARENPGTTLDMPDC